MTIAPNSADLGRPLYERFMRSEYHGKWDELPAGTRARWSDAATAIIPLATTPAEAKIFNVTAEDDSGNNVLLCVDWVDRKQADRVANHYRETYLGKPYANGKGHHSITAVRVIVDVAALSTKPGLYACGGAVDPTTILKGERGPEQFTPGQFILDCNNPSAPPIFLSSDPSHQTQSVDRQND